MLGGEIKLCFRMDENTDRTFVRRIKNLGKVRTINVKHIK